jgi:hypothetical protein
MNLIKTPDSIINELVSIREQASKGIDIQYEAETNLAQAVLALDRAEASALLESQGTVVDRQAVAKLKTEPERLAVDLARAQLNRVKTRMKLLSEAQMSVQTQARMVELTYRSAGLGER